MIPYNVGDLLHGQLPSGLYVQMQAIPGISTLDKFGENPLITPTSDPEDVWEFGGQYTYDTFGTAPIVSLSSSSAADTQVISVQGLDIEGALVTQEITLNGQTRVALTTPLWRVFRMENEADSGDDINGVVYCYTGTTNTAGVPADANVRAIINGANNQTLMALYTIPADKVGFLFKGELGIEATPGGFFSGTVAATCRYESRRVGKVFKIKKSINLMNEGSSNYTDIRSFPDIIPPLTDIRLRVQEVSDNCGIWGTFDIMLFDLDKVSQKLRGVLNG